MGQRRNGDYRYWGGTSDLEVILEKAGYTVYTVSVGPISSNWDRAVEVYYQLKGGQVDYGRGHSKTYGLVQKPEKKTYSGLYPEWDGKTKSEKDTSYDIDVFNKHEGLKVLLCGGVEYRLNVFAYIALFCSH